MIGMDVRVNLRRPQSLCHSAGRSHHAGHPRMPKDSSRQTGPIGEARQSGRI